MSRALQIKVVPAVREVAVVEEVTAWALSGRLPFFLATGGSMVLLTLLARAFAGDELLLAGVEALVSGLVVGAAMQLVFTTMQDRFHQNHRDDDRR